MTAVVLMAATADPAEACDCWALSTAVDSELVMEGGWDFVWGLSCWVVLSCCSGTFDGSCDEELRSKNSGSGN